MSLVLEVRHLFSIDLPEQQLPWPADNCCIPIDAEIGVKGQKGADIFRFQAITPAYLVEYPETRWGRGYLLLPEFSWQTVERMLNKLLSHVKADTWDEAAYELSKELNWEFENYQS